jgi:DNA-binding NtrC family response regulator
MRILIVDEGWDVRECVNEFNDWVKINSFTSIVTSDGGKAMQLVRAGNADIVILNVEPVKKNYDGRKLFKKIKNFENSISIIILIPAKDGDPSYFRLGAEGAFFLKSLDIDILISTIKNICYRDISEPYIEGISDEVRKIRNCIYSFGKFGSSYSVMIKGPEFTGHEYVASLIHKNSDRSKKSFLKIDCSSLDDIQMNRLIFGYLEPKSPDKNEEKIVRGLLAEAAGGTLFISNLEKLSVQIQKKLYSALSTGKYVPFGGNEKNALRFNIRFIASIVGNEAPVLLELKHILSELIIKLPALKERINEIEWFVKFFIKKHNHINENIKNIEEKALMLIKKFDYQGNFKQLENIIIRALVLSKADQNHEDYLKERYFLNL